MNFSEWQRYPERTSKFLEGTLKDCNDDGRKLVITPVALNEEKTSQLRKYYQSTVQKVGYFYSVPVFTHIYTVSEKYHLWTIMSASAIDEYDKFLQINYGAKLPEDIFKYHNRAGEIVDKFIRFRTGSCEEMQNIQLKMGWNGKYYGFKSINELIQFKTYRP